LFEKNTLWKNQISGSHHSERLDCDFLGAGTMYTWCQNLENHNLNHRKA